MISADVTSGRTRAVEWGVAVRPRDGSATSGDQAIIAETLSGTSLLAVADGLGHGAQAAAAAERAMSVIQEHGAETLPAIMKHCHVALADTRGVALSLAALNPADDSLTWLGVGNVIGVLVRADRPMRAWARYEQLMMRAGIVGVQLPTLHAAVLPLAPGDALFVVTDGLRPGWSDELRLGEPQRLATELVERYGKVDDDALALIARYFGKFR